MSLILDVYQVRWGWGRHTYYLLQTEKSRERLVQASKLSYMNQVNTILGLLFIKFSISILLLRIFGTKKSWRWALYSIMAFVFITTVVSFSMVLAQCRPLDKLWDPTAPGHCWSPDVVINIGYYNGGQSRRGILKDVANTRLKPSLSSLIGRSQRSLSLSCGIFR